MASISDQKLLETIYENFPITSRPFAELSKKLKISEKSIVRKIESLKKKGAIKRFKIKFCKEISDKSISCMVVWNIPARFLDEIGTKISEFNEISWCRQKPKLPNFPYNLYTMIYGKSREEVINIVRKISRSVEINHHKMLWTEKEF